MTRALRSSVASGSLNGAGSSRRRRPPISTRTLGSFAAIVSAFVLLGCSGLLPAPAEPAAQTTAEDDKPKPPAPTNNALIQAKRAGDRMELTSNLSQLAKIAMIREMTGPAFPESWDALIASDPQNKAFYEKLQEDGVIVVWDAPSMQQQVGASNAVVAYGPFALEQGGPVATMDGAASYMEADVLKEKLAAMGK